MDCGTDCNETLTDLDKALDGLPENHRRFVHAVVQEPPEVEGSRTLDLFMALKKDARLLSLLELALCISSDDLDQLLFAAEDYYAHAAKGCQ